MGPELPPLKGSRLVLGTLVLSLATFMNVLDTTIANVSIPAIAGDLGVSPNQGTWVITSFAVANAIAVPLTGWLAQRFGSVRLFVSSVILFVLASWLCGLAPSIEVLIAFRVMQGFVAGPMIPLSQALLLSAYPKEKAGMALAMWAMTTIVAPIVGPILGGVLTDNFSWPWIFYINVPVGLAAAWITWSIFHTRETPTRKLPIDGVGLALLVIWVGALQIMLDKGKELDWFASSQILALAATAFVGFCFFIAWELTDAHPVVDLHLFKRRNFSLGVVTTALAYGLFFGSVVLVPLWLQTQMGYTATWAGYAAAPVGILAIILSPVVGRLLGKVDSRIFVTIAFLIFALVMYMRSAFTTQADFFHIMWPQFIQGAAVAMFFVPLTGITLSGLGPHQIPSASGLANFARITFGAIGTSVSTTMWDSRTSLHHAQLAEKVSAYDAVTQQSLDGAGRLGMSAMQSLASIERTLNGQAAMLALNDIFWICGAIFLGMIAIVWMTKPVRGARPAAVAAD